jgi:hypothetical protein
LGLDAFLIYATSKKPDEEYRFGYMTLKRGYDKLFVLGTSIPLVINLASLIITLTAQFISFLKYQEFDNWVIKEGLNFEIPLLVFLFFDFSQWIASVLYMSYLEVLIVD